MAAGVERLLPLVSQPARGPRVQSAGTHGAWRVPGARAGRRVLADVIEASLRANLSPARVRAGTARARPHARTLDRACLPHAVVLA
eukprot:4506888-Prymnesium_polylepis.1